MKLSEKAENRVVKLLMLGDSGGGKTAALASLAKAGYHLKIHDWDNGTDILLDETVLPVEFRDNVDVMVLTDKFRGGAMGPQARPPRAFKEGMQSLAKWDGGIESWGSDTVYVCDSLTMMGDAAMRYILYMNGRLMPNVAPYQSDWGEAMKKQEEYLQLLYSSSISCHVVINCHVKMLGDLEKNEKGQTEETNIKGYPMALGRQLPPKVGRYFNNIFYVQATGSRRQIYTQSRPNVELKNARPSKIKDRYPLDTGLAQIFEEITEHKTPTAIKENTNGD